MATLTRFPLRVKFNVESRSGVDQTSANSSSSIWRGNDISIGVGIYTKASTLDGTNIASLTLQIKDKQNPYTDALAEVEVLAADITAIITDAGFAAGTEQHAVFNFSSAQTNQNLNSASSRQFWLVLSGLTDAGKVITYGAVTLVINEDNAGTDTNPPPVPASEYYDTTEINTLLALYQRGGVLTSSAAIRALDSSTWAAGTVRMVDISGTDFGFIMLTAGTDADAGTDDGPWRDAAYNAGTHAFVWKRRL